MSIPIASSPAASEPLASAEALPKTMSSNPPMAVVPGRISDPIVYGGKPAVAIVNAPVPNAYSAALPTAESLIALPASTNASPTVSAAPSVHSTASFTAYSVHSSASTNASPISFKMFIVRS